MTTDPIHRLPQRDRVLVQARVDPDLHRRLRVLAAEHGLTVTELVRHSVTRTVEHPDFHC